MATRRCSVHRSFQTPNLSLAFQLSAHRCFKLDKLPETQSNSVKKLSNMNDKLLFCSHIHENSHQLFFSHNRRENMCWNVRPSVAFSWQCNKFLFDVSSNLFTLSRRANCWSCWKHETIFYSRCHGHKFKVAKLSIHRTEVEALILITRYIHKIPSKNNKETRVRTRAWLM